LRRLATLNKEKCPLASQAIEENFYVDDFLSGASTIEEAELIQKELCELLLSVGMTLRKPRIPRDHSTINPGDGEFADISHGQAIEDSWITLRCSQ